MSFIRQPFHVTVYNPVIYSQMHRQIYDFFVNKQHFLVTHFQHHINILSACESVKNIGTFLYPYTLEGYKSDKGGIVRPLRQTGQMDAEYMLCSMEKPQGLFWHTTSYRFEQPEDLSDDPSDKVLFNRRNTVFDMFEFESPAFFGQTSYGSLKSLWRDFLKHANYKDTPEITYREALKIVGKNEDAELTAEDEAALGSLLQSNAIMLYDFPERYAFFNMKRHSSKPQAKPNTEDTDIAQKIDILIGFGNTPEEKDIPKELYLPTREVGGSAARSCNTEAMTEHFNESMGGEYRDTLFALFGMEAVLSEFEQYKALPGVTTLERFGGAIGGGRYYQIFAARKACGLL